MVKFVGRQCSILLVTSENLGRGKTTTVTGLSLNSFGVEKTNTKSVLCTFIIQILLIKLYCVFTKNLFFYKLHKTKSICLNFLRRLVFPTYTPPCPALLPPSMHPNTFSNCRSAAKAAATLRIDMQVVQSHQGDSEVCCDY